MVPWLGHMLVAKRTPPVSSPAAAALFVQRVGRLHGDQARAAVGERVPRRLEHRRAGAAAADPSFRNRAIGQDHRLGAGFGGRRRDRAHHGREREWFAGGFARRDDVENVGCRLHRSNPRQIRLERSEAFEIVRRREQIDVRQCRLHAAGLRRIIAPADQRIEPDDSCGSGGAAAASPRRVVPGAPVS